MVSIDATRGEEAIPHGARPGRAGGSEEEGGEFEDRGASSPTRDDRFEPFFNSGPYTTIQRVKGSVQTDLGPSEEEVFSVIRVTRKCNLL